MSAPSKSSGVGELRACVQDADLRASAQEQAARGPGRPTSLPAARIRKCLAQCLKFKFRVSNAESESGVRRKIGSRGRSRHGNETGAATRRLAQAPGVVCGGAALLAA